MKTTSIRARALSCALLGGTALCGLASAPAAAQTSPTFRNLDANGVDLVRGDFLTGFPEGSIGSGEAELALLRMLGATGGSGTEGSSQWDHIALNLVSSGTWIDFGSHSDKFPGAETRGATLSGSGNSYQYRSPDGTIIAFGDSTPNGDATNFCDGTTKPSCMLIPTSVTSPDGKVVSINYEFWTLCIETAATSGPPYYLPAEGEPSTIDCQYTPRIASVINSYGYEIRFAYASAASSGATTNPPATFHRRTGASFYNNQASSTPLASVSYSYPSTGVTDVTDQGGRIWRVTSASTNYAIRRPGAPADTTSATLGGGVVTSVVKDGVTTNYSRSVSGSVATMVVTNALSQATTIVSNLTSGRPTSVTDPLGRTTGFAYDGNDRPTRTTAPEGNYVEQSYDARGNVIQTVAVPKGGVGPTIVTSASFDSTCSNPVTCNQPNSTTDARGSVTDYTYDPTHGGVLTVTAPAVGGVRPQTRYTYTLTNGEYHLTGVSQCRTASFCAGAADEVKTALAYDSNGNLYWTASGDGAGTLVAASTMSYDALGNLVTVDGPLPGSADTGRVRYDAARQAIGIVSPDPDGAGPLKHRAVRNSHDSSTGLLTKVEQGNVNGPSDSDWAAFAPAHAVETSYDSNARPVVSKLVSGSTVHALSQTGYDALGRPECSAQRMNPALFDSTLPAACTLGTQGTGANDYGPDRIAKAVYDAAGRVYQTKVAVGTAEEATEITATFTANGQLETVTDAENNKTTYEYDGHDRLLNTRYPVSTKGALASAPTSGPTADFEQLGYDANGNVVTFRNRAGQSIGFGHDALDRVTHKDLPGSEPDVTYTYDLLGRMTGASQTGHSIGFEWDSLGRLVAQTNPIGTVTAEYDLAGRRTLLKWPADPTFPLGHKAVYERLVTGEVSVMREGAPLTGPLDASFAYDDLGRRVGISRGNGASTGYAFDASSRLSSLSHDFAGTTRDLMLGFSYNPAGQLVSATRSNDSYSWTGHGSGSTGSSVDGLNRLAAQGGVTFTHDPKGNLESDGTRSFGYSSENLALTQISGGSTITRTYDPLNRLSSTYATGGRAPTQFLWFGDELIGEYHSGNVVGRFVHGPGVDEPMLIVGRDGTRTWLHADERGSVVARSDSTGAAPWVVTYDEYGRSPAAFRFGFTGQMHLSGNLYYYKSRMYDTGLGRFLQPDPIGYGDGMNMYAYVGGDPVNFADPSGLCKDGAGKSVSAPTGSRICGGGSGGIASSRSPGSSLALGGNGNDGLSGAIFVPGSPGSVSSGGNTIIVTGKSPGQSINPGSWGSSNFHLAGGGWWDSHDFQVGPFFICPDSSGCRQAILDVFPSYIVPNLGEAVVNGKVSPIYRFPEGWFLVGHVRTFISNDGLSATNVTMSDHMLRHGQVDISNRLVGGSWYVGARGYGNNLPFMGTLNQFFGPGIFSGMLGSYVMVVRSRIRR
ncbi:MAG TPA: RHS repeat-associated core domain-containing protein [Allosphingosinicella sp.]|jgi:RHS repeat-associated protein